MINLQKIRTALGFALLSTALLGPVAFADDTEIFFGQSKDAFNTNPNVLFVLDTSGSMGWYDGGTTSRMDRMKLAMRVLLRESSSYNVGLMGFSGGNRGGSIRYPVGDLEADSGNFCPDGICPDERVVSRPGSSADDATQNDDTQVVTLNAPSLVMSEVEQAATTTAATTSEEVQGSAYATAVVAENEVGETADARTITSASQWFYNGTPDTEDDHYAYRFEGIDIPLGAVVTSAYLTFTQTNAAAQTGNLSALVKLEYSADPDELPTAVNGLPSIATRLITATTGIQWNNIPPDTTILETGAADAPADPITAPAANKATTPDLSDILNLIVTLPTWEQGNAMSFILDPVDEYKPTPGDIREFHGIDVAEALQPVLNYTYTTSVTSDIETTLLEAESHLDEITEQNTDIVSRHLSNPSARALFAESTYYPRKLAFRFNDIDIPKDAEIQSVSLLLAGTEDETTETPIHDWVIDDTTVIAESADADELGVLPDGLSASPDSAATDAPPPTATDPAVVENKLLFNVSAEATGTPLPYSSDPLSTREFTDQFEPWEDIIITPGELISSPNLADVVSSVINTDTWTSGESLSLVLSAPATYNNVLENSALIDTSTGAKPPSLSITWKQNTSVNTALKNSQTTAIRFANIHVPPRATIKSARMVFTAANASLGENTLEISAENASSSEPFMAVDNNLGSRQRTPDKVTWEVPPWEIPNEKYTSADFKSVVQQVVDLPEWCGGNPMTIMLEKIAGEDSRIAISADTNEISAPSLEITYAPDTVPSGAYCSNATILSSVSSGIEDATEDLSTSIVELNAASLDSMNATTGQKQKIGIKFPSLGIPKDAVIVSATLGLNYEKAVTVAQNYKFEVAQTVNTPEFNNTDQKITATSRNYNPNSVTGTITPGDADSSIRVDVAELIKLKVQDENWVPGKPIVIAAEALGGIAQSFYSYDADEARAPQLIVYYQSQREKPGTLFRDNLTAIVDSLVAQGGTPIVGAYYEAAQYFTGRPVDYGLQRGNQRQSDRFHRVSHPLSYFDGEVNLPWGCYESNPNSQYCRGERILPKDGKTPTYLSPMESECQQNHIVLLSDGEATSNSAKAKVRAMTGDATCAAFGDDACGVELASWLNTTDVNGLITGPQNVITHTIGFNLSSPDFLKSISSAGGGNFYAAESSSDLLNAFKNIFINVSKTDTSFVAPSATVSQSNRLKNREDIYFSLFKPEATARWAGNLKRYRLGGVAGDNADILDVTGALAVDDRTGRFFSTAKSYWSDVVDGDSVQLGGAAEKIEIDGVTHRARNVFTYTGSDPLLTNGYSNDLLPENTYIDRKWLRLTSTLEADEDYVSTLLNWAHGQDIYDVDGDGDTDEARGQMGDPMHSQPLLVNYAGGRSVVHVATNEGYLHAIDHETGRENFAFIPKELLGNLRRNFENQPTDDRPYGLDGGMSLWIQDANKDGIVDTGTDKAYLYIGMRRGGNLYYALDISDPDNPSYLWSIAGGANSEGTTDPALADGNFIELGQTWSKPVKSKILVQEEVVDVLIFGAGYGSNQDPIDTDVLENEDGEIAVTDPLAIPADDRQKRAEDTVGRGFFIVNAETGKRIWNTEQAFYPDMKYSVPSELRVVDINFDGMADQIYFGDMGGQVWRFDYNNDMAINKSADDRINGGRIARFAGDTPESARRFYYPPDVALVSIQGEQQLAVSIGSGWRAHPLDTDVEDRFYSFRMTQVYGVPRTEDGDIRYPEVTEFTTDMIDLSKTDAVRVTNKDERGWFLPMSPGEKVLSSSVTIDNSLVFTTYIPSNISNTCAAAIGSGAVYFVDLATGSPIKNLEDDSEGGTSDLADEDAPFEAGDRRRRLPASGIPPAATVLFPELGKATVFAGRDKLGEVQIDSLKQRTFWQEHIDENL